MNIFYLDDDLQSCVEYHCDKHVVKMITEYTQLLSACTRILDGENIVRTYRFNHKVRSQKLNVLQGENVVQFNLETKWQHTQKRPEYLLSHAKHPDTLWLLESSQHWFYLQNLTRFLYSEYRHRYNKDHKAGEIASTLLPSEKLSDHGFSRPPLCMPDECKLYDFEGVPLIVDSYRRYYNLKKQHIAQWTGREKPAWFHHAEE